MQLLRFLVSNTRNSDGLKEIFIGSVFYHRPASYDPRLDSIVRVNVNRLRQRLEEYYAQEGRDEPYRIEIPRGTYKPVAVQNELLKQPSLSLVEAPALPLPPPPSAWFQRVLRPLPITFLVLSLVVVATSTIWVIYQSRVRSFANPRFGSRVILTSSSNIDMDPAISPDGKQMVYSSRPYGGGRTHLFLRPYSEQTLTGQVLDTGPGDSEHPAWSPDGNRIAFYNCGLNSCDIRVLTLTTGKVEFVHALPGEILTEDVSYLSNQESRPVWTPDGKALIFPVSTIASESGPGGEQIIQYDLATHTEKPLTKKMDSDWLGPVALSPDGRTLAFLRDNSSQRVIVWMDRTTLTQHVLPTVWNASTDSLTWWPDGKSLVTSSYSLGVEGGWYVWRVPLQGDPVTIGLPSVSIPVNPVIAPGFSGKGKSLLVLSVIQDRRLVMLDGKNEQQGPATLFDAHTNRVTADVSSDGKQIAMLRSQDGVFEVWLANLEHGVAGPARQLTHGLKIHHPQSLKWSPDGKSIAVGLMQQPVRIWLVDAVTGKISGVSTPGLDSKQLRMPQWSADGRKLLVADGHQCIDEIAVGPIPAARCVVQDESPDNLRVYGPDDVYYERRFENGIYHASLTGGAKPQLVPQLANVRLSKNWTIAGDGLYYVDLHDVQRRLQRFDLKTGAITTVLQRVPGILFDATVMSYSPQANVLLYTQMAGSSSSQIVGFPLQ